MRAQVEIAFNFNPNTQISAPETFSEQANVSHAEKIFEDSRFKGFQGFHFAAAKGEWPADASGMYHYYPDEGYKGFISRGMSNEEGTFSSSISIQVQIDGDMPNELFIQFDAICNEFATQMKVTSNQNSNTMLVNNSKYVCKIALDSLNLVSQEETTILSIELLKWNKAFKGVKITRISVNYVGVYDASELISFECSENLLNAQMQVSAGVCEQYADVEIYDRSGMLHELATDEILNGEQNITVLAIDDEANSTEILGVYSIGDWDVPSTSSRVKLSAKDNSSTLDELYVSMLPIKDRDVDELLNLCFSQLKNTSWKYIDEDTKTYCKSIITPNSWCYTGTLLETLVKVCLLGMLRIYWYVDSYIVARCY